MTPHEDPKDLEIQRLRRQISTLEKLLGGAAAGGVEPAAKLQAERAFLQAILDHSPVALSVKDLQGRYVLVNREFERLSGRGRGDILGKSAGELFPETLATALSVGDRDVVEGGGKVEREETWPGPEGERRLLSIRFPIAGADGKVRMIGGSWTDVTEHKRDLDRLRESEERYRDLFENATDLLQSLDPDGRVLYANRAWRETLGYEEDEVPHVRMTDFIHPDSLPHCLKLFQRVMAGEEVESIEAKFITKQGRTLEVEGTATCKMENGKPLHTRGVFRDVTARRRMKVQEVVTMALAEARGEKETLREVLRSVTEALGWRIGAAWLHDAATGTLRCADFWSATPARLADFEKATRERVFEPGVGIPGRVLSSKKPAWVPDVLKDSNFPQAPFAARAGIHGAVGFPLIHGGNVLGVVEFFSERIEDPDPGLTRMLESVGYQLGQFLDRRRVEDRFRAVVEASPYAMFMADRRGRIVLANSEAATLFGYAPEELPGMSIEALVPPRLRVRHGPQQEGFFSDPRTRPMGAGRDLSGVRKDGVEIPVEIGLSPVMTPEGPHVLASVINITERKKVEKMKNEFVSIVSHELRTPLTSIVGSLGLISGGVAGPLTPEMRSMIDIARNNSERLVRLINDMLDLEKIEAGRVEFHIRPLDLEAVVRQTVESNRSLETAGEVALEMEGEAPGVQVLADPDRLVQVVTNLISNAVKFSPAGGVVSIRVRRMGAGVRVEVSDRGPGIPLEFQRRIFERFAQADSADSRKKGGSGLGLSIAKAIVERMGGAVGFATEIGKGTTFYFDLPEYRIPSPDTAMFRDGPKPRILVCEDEPDVARILSMILRDGGFESDVAPTAAEARRLLKSGNYAAMTADLRLPDSDGLSLVRELRENEKTRHLPVVVISGDGSAERRQFGRTVLGVAGWITKPIHEGILLSILRLAIQSASRRRPRILHVEGDADNRTIVAAVLKDLADIRSARTLAEGRIALQRGRYDLILLDLSLPDGSGMRLLEWSRSTPVVVLSSFEVPSPMPRGITAALVKSRATNEAILKTVREVLGLDSLSGVDS